MKPLEWKKKSDEIDALAERHKRIQKLLEKQRIEEAVNAEIGVLCGDDDEQYPE